MKLTIWLVAFWALAAAIAHGQQSATLVSQTTQSSSVEATVYTVQGTTLERAQLLQSQIRTMQPAVLPTRIVFVPHWQYLYAMKIYHLHMPAGMACKMFTHLPSRSVYIDNDLYGGDEWLGHWMAHELGHLERNNADEREAEKAAGTYRKRLEQARRLNSAH